MIPLSKITLLYKFIMLLVSYHIVQYSTIYRDHEGLGILARNYHPKTSLIFAFWHFGSIG